MTHATSSSAGGFRISLELDPPLHRVLEAAAAARDRSIGQYILEAIKDRLQHESDERSEATALTAAADPVLAELWDNSRDAEYDHL
jgi:uncharacterized protein (DUF1778 family)